MAKYYDDDDEDHRVRRKSRRAKKRRRAKQDFPWDKVLGLGRGLLLILAGVGYMIVVAMLDIRLNPGFGIIFIVLGALLIARMIGWLGGGEEDYLVVLQKTPRQEFRRPI